MSAQLPNSRDESRVSGPSDSLNVDWNDIRLRVLAAHLDRLHGSWDPKPLFQEINRKIVGFADKSATEETSIKQAFEQLQGDIGYQDYDLSFTLERLLSIVTRLVDVCKYLESNCAGLKEVLDRLLAEGHLSLYEITQLVETSLPTRRLTQLLEVSTFRVLEGQIQHMYQKLARDCYAPGAPLAQSLLHEEPLRNLKFSIRDFTQCLQTAVAWRELEQYMDTPDYTSFTGLLLMLGLSFGCGFGNHYMSDDLHPDTIVYGAVGTLVVSGVMSCATHKRYKRTLVIISFFLMLSHFLFLIGSLSNESGLLQLSGMMVRMLDSRLLVIRYIADTVSTRRQTHWMSLSMMMEAVGVSLSYAIQTYAGVIQGGVWVALTIVGCTWFEDYTKRVSSPAMHQGRSLTATLVCIWILFFSNFLAENSLPYDLMSPVTFSSSLLFAGVAVVLFVFSIITMFVKNRVFVLLAFALSFVSLLLESDRVISAFPCQVVVLLAMHLTNTISITFLVKKLPLKQGEGFWNSGFLSVLIVHLGELGIHFIRTALDNRENEDQTILWPSTGLSALTCLLILIAWRMLDFQITKPKTG